MLPFILILSEEDESFLIEIYTEYYPLFKWIAINIVHDDTLADDLVQDSIVRLISNLTKIKKTGNPVSYCAKTVHRTCINYIQKKQRRHHILSKQKVIDATSHDLSLEDNAETKDDVLFLFNELDDRDWLLLYHKYMMDCDNTEIGKVLGIKPRSVSTYLTRAKQRAKELLTKRGNRGDEE